MVNGITRFVRERVDFVRVNYARLLSSICILTDMLLVRTVSREPAQALCANAGGRERML